MTLQATIENILQKACSGDEAIPGALFGAIDRKGNYLVKARAGYKGVDRKDEQMSFDTVFAMFSCSKIVTAIAVMQLVDQGKIDLDQPAELYLPDLKGVKMVDGSAPKTKVTTRQLLTHTSGCGYSFLSPELAAIFKEQGIEHTTLSAGLSMPLIAQPGENWNYGVGIDWAGRVLEKVTGQTLGQWVETNISDPLGAHDIGYSVLPFQDQKRLVSMHRRNADGSVVQIEHFPETQNSPFDSGGGGALGTLDRIISVLINDGVGANGARILKKETVDEMFRDQLEGKPPGINKALYRVIKSHDHSLTGDFTLSPGIDKGYGITGIVNKEVTPSGRSTRSLNWSGLPNLFWVADRQRGIASFFCSQVVPSGDPIAYPTWQECETALNTAFPPK